MKIALGRKSPTKNAGALTSSSLYHGCFCLNFTGTQNHKIMAGYNSNLSAVGQHLDEGENIIESCFGAYETKIMGSDSVRNGVFLVTEKRVVFFGKKLMGYDMESFPLSKVSAIEMSKGLMGKSIAMKMSGNDAKMKWIQKGNPEGVVNYVRENMGEKVAAPVASTGSDDIPAQIQKLASLKDAGILTEEEFATKKAELLAKM